MSLWILWDAPTKPAFFHLEGVIKTEGWEKSVYMYSLCVQITILSFSHITFKMFEIGAHKSVVAPQDLFLFTMYLKSSDSDSVLHL